MRKIIAICLILIVACTCLVALHASAYDPIVSPTAATYTTEEDLEDKTISDHTDRNKGENTTIVRNITSPYYAIEGRSLAHRYSPNYTGVDSGEIDLEDASARWNWKWTKSYTNDGKDDPDSPNYTGDVSVSSDKSSKSPDTGAGVNFAPVIAAVVILMGTFAFSGKALRKKEEN